jgi:DNA-directed RNA polymerase specialized sigma24 family protein
MARDLESVFEDLLERVAKASAKVREDVQEQTWRAFYLEAYEGMTADEVANQLGISKSSVYTARSRVLRRLREELSDLDGGAHDQ